MIFCCQVNRTINDIFDLVWGPEIVRVSDVDHYFYFDWLVGQASSEFVTMMMIISIITNMNSDKRYI